MIFNLPINNSYFFLITVIVYYNGNIFYLFVSPLLFQKLVQRLKNNSTFLN